MPAPPSWSPAIWGDRRKGPSSPKICWHRWPRGWPLLGRDVPLLSDWIDGVQVQPGQVVLLENCRVNVGEKRTLSRWRAGWQRCAISS